MESNRIRASDEKNLLARLFDDAVTFELEAERSVTGHAEPLRLLEREGALRPFADELALESSGNTRAPLDLAVVAVDQGQPDT